MTRSVRGSTIRPGLWAASLAVTVLATGGRFVGRVLRDVPNGLGKVLGQRLYPVEFAWEACQKNFMMLKHGMATVGGVMGLPASAPLDTLTPPPQMQAAIGGVMKMIAGASGGGEATAPGAAASLGFRTDTALRGPWDGAALLHGTQLIAVRHDVFVGVGLQSADYDRAKALLTAICSAL